MRGIKSANGKQELTGRDIITGKNGAGKTTRAQALGISLLGYVPGGGKLATETMKLANGDSMTMGLDTDDFTLQRSFTRKGAKIEQTIELNPPLDEKSNADKEKRIEHELGKMPVMLDFNEFLSLTDMKRREFIFTLAEEADEETGELNDKEAMIEALRQKITLPDDSDPQQIEIYKNDIKECAEKFEDGLLLQTNLQNIHSYAKEQLSFWKKERDKSSGASQKIAEYKNNLTETDLSLEANNMHLEEMQAKYIQLTGELAKINTENERHNEYNRRIHQLAQEIAALTDAVNTESADAIKDDIEYYSGLISQKDNSAAIEFAQSQVLYETNRIPDFEKNIEKYREEYQTARAQKAASESLIKKIKEHTGTCPIDPRIKCEHDFKDFMMEIGLEAHKFDTAMREISQSGTAARADLETARQNAKNAQDTINRLRQEEITALRENEQIQRTLNDLQGQLRKIEGFDAEKTARITAKREELVGLLPEGFELTEGYEELLPDVAEVYPITSTKELIAEYEATSSKISEIKAKIAEQTKARNALATLRSTMVDGTMAEYHTAAWKRIADEFGPKGLQGELVKNTLTPLTHAVQEKLDKMNINKAFFFQTEDEKGKEIFQFGWCDAEVRDKNKNSLPLKSVGKCIGEPRNFDALSTGEQMLLLIALMTTIIEWTNPPLKVLVIDNAENLDSENIIRVLNGLTTAGMNLDNIIFSGVMDIDPATVPDWRVWDLSGGAVQ
jgi:exonuclease SbcC